MSMFGVFLATLVFMIGSSLSCRFTSNPRKSGEVLRDGECVDVNGCGGSPAGCGLGITSSSSPLFSPGSGALLSRTSLLTSGVGAHLRLMNQEFRLYLPVGVSIMYERDFGTGCTIFAGTQLLCFSR